MIPVPYVSGTGVAGFSEAGNFYEYTISANSREVILCDASGTQTGVTGSMFKMVSDVESEFFNSSSVGSPWGSLVGAVQTGVYPDIHTLATIQPGGRFYIGYTTEHPHEAFTNLFRLSTEVLPVGTLIRLGIRNGNQASPPIISDPNQFAISPGGVSAATVDAACQPITFTEAPADISGVDTSLFTWANFVMDANAFDFHAKGGIGRRRHGLYGRHRAAADLRHADRGWARVRCQRPRTLLRHHRRRSR